MLVKKLSTEACKPSVPRQLTHSAKHTEADGREGLQEIYTLVIYVFFVLFRTFVELNLRLRGRGLLG